MAKKSDIKGLRALDEETDFDKKFLPGHVYHPIAEAVKLAPQFMFSLRGDSVIIYYKCNKVLTIKNDKKPFDINMAYILELKNNKKTPVLGDLYLEYISEDKIVRKQKKVEHKNKPLEYKTVWQCVGNQDVFNNMDTTKTSDWLKFLLMMAAYIDDDKNNGGDEDVEKEIQQRIVLENNLLGKSESTDYYIFDTEYTAKQFRQDKINNGKFDAVAVHYSENCELPQLAFIEVKAGNKAVSEKQKETKEKTSGVYDHWFDVVKFNNISEEFFDDKIKMLDQLNAFGFLKLPDNLKDCVINKQIGRKHFQMIFVLANYDQSGTELISEIEDIEKAINGDFRKNNLPAHEMARIKENVKYIDLRFATSSFMGYGLYDECMLTLNQFKDLLKTKRGA